MTTPEDGIESQGETGPDPSPRLRMAHFDPKAVQSKRLMAHPVRHGFLGALDRLRSGVFARSGGLALRERGTAGSRRRDLVTVLVLLAIATAVTATLPGGWAGSVASTSSPSPTADPTALGLSLASPTVAPSPSPTAMPSPSPVVSPSASPTVKPSPTPTPVPYRFVALGDSLTAWPTDSPWPELLDARDARLELVHNAGVPGNTTAQMLARFQKDVVDHDPQVLFILGGTNDIGRGISQATTIANLKAIVVAALNKKMRVFLMLLPPESSSAEVSKIDSMNAAITHLANTYKVVWIDIHAPLSTTTGVYQTKYTSDGLHFNALGAQTVANAIYSRIHRLGY